MEQDNLLAQEASKRNFERSASYPGINLQRAEEVAATVANHFGYGKSINREDIGAVLKLSTAAASRPIAAAVQFGYLDRIKDKYKITTAYKELVHHFSEAEKQRRIIDAFRSPKLYRELIEKFDGRTVPVELARHLVRDHNITANAAGYAADIFMQSANYAGVLTEHNILKVEDRYNSLNDVEKPLIDEYFPNLPKDADVISSTPVTSETSSELSQIVEQTLIPQLPEAAGLQTLEIKVTGKQIVTFRYMDTLTAKDFKLIKKHLDLLAEAMDIEDIEK